ERAVRLAQRTHQLLAHDPGVADTVDPLGGSYAVERLTRDIEAAAEAYITRIDAQGGAVQAIGFMQREIQEAAYRWQREVEDKRRVVVGVNEFVTDHEPPAVRFSVGPGAAAALAGALLAAAMVAGLAAAGAADRIGATFTLMADEFIQAFQPVEGIVVSLDGDEIFLDIGATRGAQVGQEYTIFRKGAPFLHPLTGRPLGRYEDVLGWAQVKRVQPEFAIAAFVRAPDKPTPQPEDGARITRGRIKIAVAPVLDMTATGADLRRVPYLLGTVLERSKRFQVVDPIAVGDMFASGGLRVEEMLARPERAVRAAKNLDVAGWVVPVLLERRGAVTLDVTYISAI